MQSFNYKQPTEPCYWPWKIGATSAQQPRLYIYNTIYIYTHLFGFDLQGNVKKETTLQIVYIYNSWTANNKNGPS
jgi:hypothetical protein